MGHPNIWVRRVITDTNKHEDFGRDVTRIWSHTPNIRASEHHCFERNGKQEVNATRTYCGYPSQRIVVDTSGKAYPCCVDYGQTMPIGDLTRQTIAQVWASKKLNTLRYALKSNQIDHCPRACKNCTSWMAYNDPRRQMVMDKEIKR